MIANEQVLVEHNLHSLSVTIEELWKMRSNLDESGKLILEECAIKLNALIKRQILKLDMTVVKGNTSKIGEIHV